MEIITKIKSLIFTALAVFFILKYTFPMVGALVKFFSNILKWLSKALMGTW